MNGQVNEDIALYYRCRFKQPNCFGKKNVILWGL